MTSLIIRRISTSSTGYEEIIDIFSICHKNEKYVIESFKILQKNKRLKSRDIVLFNRGARTIEKRICSICEQYPTKKDRCDGCTNKLNRLMNNLSANKSKNLEEKLSNNSINFTS